MSILWTIIIGFVAGLIAKFLHPGSKNEPSPCSESRDHLLRRIWAKRSGGTKPVKALDSLEQSLVQS